MFYLLQYLAWTMTNSSCHLWHKCSAIYHSVWVQKLCKFIVFGGIWKVVKYISIISHNKHIGINVSSSTLLSDCSHIQRCRKSLLLLFGAIFLFFLLYLVWASFFSLNSSDVKSCNSILFFSWPIIPFGNTPRRSVISQPLHFPPQTADTWFVCCLMLIWKLGTSCKWWYFVLAVCSCF